MLYVRFYRVHDDQVDRLRSWMREINRRREEALATYAREGTRHEVAYLMAGGDHPVLVYVAEVEDVERARQAFLSSEHEIDLKHREMMRQVVSEKLYPELLYECVVGAG